VTLRHVGFTPVPPGSKPGFDHADIYLDPRGDTLYVAHTGADRIDVVDCRTGRYLRALGGLPGVAWVLVDNTQGLLFSSDRAAARVSVFSCPDEVLVAQVEVGPRPNALAYDPARGNLFSFNIGEPAGTNCTASVVSIDERRVRTTIPLSGRPRWAVFDAATQAVYVNIAEPAAIALIDADRLSLRDAIPVPAAGPHGLAIVDDERSSTLWCAADAGVLVVIDRDSREIEAKLPLPGTPDVVMHDRDLRRLYVAVGSPGRVSVFDTHGRQEIEKIPTEEGAHTIGWDPASRRLFVFEPNSCGVAIFEDAA